MGVGAALCGVESSAVQSTCWRACGGVALLGEADQHAVTSGLQCTICIHPQSYLGLDALPSRGLAFLLTVMLTPLPVVCVGHLPACLVVPYCCVQVFEINPLKAWSAVAITLASVAASLYLISVSPWYLLPFAWFIAGTAFTGVSAGRCCCCRSGMQGQGCEGRGSGGAGDCG